LDLTKTNDAVYKTPFQSLSDSVFTFDRLKRPLFNDPTSHASPILDLFLTTLKPKPRFKPASILHIKQCFAVLVFFGLGTLLIGLGFLVFVNFTVTKKTADKLSDKICATARSLGCGEDGEV
jgi:hypothetical protein